MAKPLIHLPADFEWRDDVRTLGRLLAGELAPGLSPPLQPALVSAFALRLWLEWGRAGVDWRPLQGGVTPTDAAGWQAENLAHLIEQACGWPGPGGRLVHLLVVAGALRPEARGELTGLVLADFALYNPHLLPGFVSRESKGGIAKAEKARLREALVAAAQQEKLLLDKGLDLFAADVTPEERRQAIAFIMGLDQACGRALRATSEYERDVTLLREAVAILRRSTPEDRVAVQRYLIRRRTQPDAAHDAAPVVRAFDDFLRKSKE